MPTAVLRISVEGDADVKRVLGQIQGITRTSNAAIIDAGGRVALATDANPG